MPEPRFFSPHPRSRACPWSSCRPIQSLTALGREATALIFPQALPEQGRWNKLSWSLLRSHFRMLNWWINLGLSLAQCWSAWVLYFLCNNKSSVRKDKTEKGGIQQSLNRDLPCLHFPPINSSNLAYFCLFPHFYTICPKALLTTEASWILLHHLFLCLQA